MKLKLFALLLSMLFTASAFAHNIHDDEQDLPPPPKAQTKTDATPVASPDAKSDAKPGEKTTESADVAPATAPPKQR